MPPPCFEDEAVEGVEPTLDLHAEQVDQDPVLAQPVALAGPWLLARGLELAALPRSALAVALVAPLAAAMGLPFPLALARVRAAAPALVPWAWGVNGCASAVAAALAGLLAMSFGARGLLLLLGALAYALAAWVQRGIPHGDPGRRCRCER
jgi:hypothetical protein